MSGTKDSATLVLFDVDGTLTLPRKLIEAPMIETLHKLREKVVVGVIGGSDYVKIQEQLGGKKIEDEYDYVFTENGLVSFKQGQPLPQADITGYLGEDNLKKFINFTLRYIADLDIPIKRGTFIEFRKGMINVSPIGRNCSYDERVEFERYDKEANVRKNMVEALKKEFPDLGLKYSIGGLISFDVFPIGWDKTYCLRHVEKDGFKTIHFFGDKTTEGGNDYELYIDPHVIGHNTTSPEHTILQLTELFKL